MPAGGFGYPLLENSLFEEGLECELYESDEIPRVSLVYQAQTGICKNFEAFYGMTAGLDNGDVPSTGVSKKLTATGSFRMTERVRQARALRVS
jgi:hypothetical protein